MLLLPTIDTVYVVIIVPVDNKKTERGLFCTLCSKLIWDCPDQLDTHINSNAHKKWLSHKADDGYNHLRTEPNIHAPLKTEYRMYIHKKMTADGEYRMTCALCKGKEATGDLVNQCRGG